VHDTTALTVDAANSPYSLLNLLFLKIYRVENSIPEYTTVESKISDNIIKSIIVYMLNN